MFLWYSYSHPNEEDQKYSSPTQNSFSDLNTVVSVVHLSFLVETHGASWCLQGHLREFSTEFSSLLNGIPEEWFSSLCMYTVTVG